MKNKYGIRLEILTFPQITGYIMYPNTDFFLNLSSNNKVFNSLDSDSLTLIDSYHDILSLSVK